MTGQYIGPRVGFPNFYRGPANWAGTPQHEPRALLPGGGHLNSDGFPVSASPDAIMIVVGTGGAAQGATTVPVTITLPASGTPVNSMDFPSASTIRPLPPGIALEFGTTKFARVTTLTYLNATSLTTEPLPQALVAGDTAYFTRSNRLFVRSGTLVGRTYAERDAGIGYGPADVVNDNQIRLLYFDVVDALRDNACELYVENSGNLVYEDLLPGWSTMSSNMQAWIRLHYICEPVGATEQVFV